VLVLATAACGYHPDTGVVHLSDPGKCVPVDVAAGPETAALLAGAASRFNGSAAARLRDGACAFVRVETVDSPVALRELASNWPDAARLGPAPVAWVPGSTMWAELLNARLADRHRRPVAPAGTPFARSPLVIAMPAAMARALGSPARPIGWADLEQLARDRRGWAAFGHPEWGAFRLGKGNPNWSTTGLDATIALDGSSAAGRDARLLEQSVVYYGDTTQAYFDNWRRLAKTSTSSALTYLSAAITDERSVIAYDTGHEQDDVSLTGHLSRPALPLVAIYPKDTAVESDHPIVVLDVPWSSAAARAGARAFTKFALQAATQAKVAAAGFRPAAGAVRPDVVSPGNGVDPAARSNPVAPSSPVEIERSLARWQTNRRPARLLVVFDSSDSMGDPADPTKPHGPTKIALARTSLAGALDQLAPFDEIGLRIFSTDLANPAHPNWSDVVPTGTFAARGPALRTAIAALGPRRGSPLYAATRDAFDAIAGNADAGRINGVVVLTDGYNEVDHDNNRRALLAHLATRPDVRVFTIAYGDGADVATLKKMAQATNAWTFDATATYAWTFDATQTKDLADVLPRVLASF
jgi:Ca-activated chloride channel family protein